MVYYNEYDRNAAAWLRGLMAEGLIPDGVVDERSIVDVQPEDLKGFSQCHFFAGIGGWPGALRLAGWPDDRSVWTGSCPCPPFSCAGKKKVCPKCHGVEGKGITPHPLATGVFVCADEECGHNWIADGRHLWPEFHRLISQCRPPVVFGEQVSSEDGRFWLAGVRATLEIIGYGVGAGDICAAGCGAPHIRQRLFWVAHSQLRRLGQCDQGQRGIQKSDADSADGGLANTALPEKTRQRKQPEHIPEAASFWSNWQWHYCRDGKWRRIPGPQPVLQPKFDGLPDGMDLGGAEGAFPLAKKMPHRPALLKGYGNAICPELAAEFVKAFMEISANQTNTP